MADILITPRSFGSTSSEPFDILKKQGYTLHPNETGERYDKEQMKKLIRDKDGVIIGTDPLDGEVISAARNLKVISKYGVGLDNIDLERAGAENITVTNTPDANSASVAELAFGMIYTLARRIAEADRKTKQGFEGKIVGSTLWGKTLGIIGMGSIGRELARRANGFNMDVFYYDIEPLSAGEEQRLQVSYRPLGMLLQKSDFISLHVPLNENTENMLGEEEFKLMKDSALLINTARERIVEEDVLLQALEEGWIGGAGLDEFELAPGSIPESTKDKLILTPHMGAHTGEAINNMGVTAARNLIAALEGGKITEDNLVL